MAHGRLKIRSILALAAIVGVGDIARGVTLTQGYTLAQISTTSNFAAGTTTSVTLSATGFNAVTMVPGEYFRFGVTESVSGDPNPVSGDAWDTDQVNNQGNNPQPANLGLLGVAMEVGSSDTAGSLVAPLSVQGLSTATLASKTTTGWAVTDSGDVKGGLVGDSNQISGATTAIDDATGLGGETPNSPDAPLTDFTAAGPDPSFFTGLTYKDIASSPGSPVTLSPTIFANGTAYWVATSLGTLRGAGPSYALQFFGSNDTVTTLSPIVINPVPEPSSFALLSIAGMGLLARRRKRAGVPAAETPARTLA